MGVDGAKSMILVPHKRSSVNLNHLDSESNDLLAQEPAFSDAALSQSIRYKKPVSRKIDLCKPPVLKELVSAGGIEPPTY